MCIFWLYIWFILPSYYNPGFLSDVFSCKPGVKAQCWFCLTLHFWPQPWDVSVLLSWQDGVSCLTLNKHRLQLHPSFKHEIQKSFSFPIGILFRNKVTTCSFFVNPENIPINLCKGKSLPALCCFHVINHGFDLIFHPLIFNSI